MKHNKLIQQILKHPAKTVSTLSNAEIKEILIETIEAYMKNIFSFTQLVQLVIKIEIYQSENLSFNTKMIIKEISSYYTIDIALKDMLKELKEIK